MSSTCTFSVKDILSSGLGTSVKYNIDDKISYKDLELDKNVQADVELMHGEKLVAVTIKNLKTGAIISCTRCLKKLHVPVNIEIIEKDFKLNKAEEDDIFDTLYVNKSDYTIDLGELIRQEIILQFPINPLCSKSCKGLCEYCGKDKNVIKCSCKDLNKEGNFLLASLKDLVK